MATRERLFAVPPELKPYLTYSLGAHFVLALVVAKLIAGASVPSTQVYTIDFVGPSTTIISQFGPASAPKPAAAPAPVEAKPAPDAAKQEFSTHKTKPGHFALPRPSLLKGAQAQKEEQAEEAAQEAPTPDPGAPSAVQSAGGAPGDASVSADMSHFPYPWYIAQVRSALWQQWSKRMGGLHGECVVVFTLTRDGKVTDVRAEETSGDSAFDLAALGSVQDGGPYPALPGGFAEPFLKIHVTLKAQ